MEDYVKSLLLLGGTKWVFGTQTHRQGKVRELKRKVEKLGVPLIKFPKLIYLQT